MATSEPDPLARLFHALSPDAQAAALVYGVVDPHVCTVPQVVAILRHAGIMAHGRPLTNARIKDANRELGDAGIAFAPGRGRGSEGLLALGAVADDGSAPRRDARPNRGRPPPRAARVRVLQGRSAGRDGAALPHRRWPLRPNPRRHARADELGVPGRARRRLPAPHPAGGLAGSRPRRLPDARPPRRRFPRAHHRGLPHTRVGSAGVRREHRLRPHPSGPSRRGGRGLRHPSARAPARQAREDRPRRGRGPRRHAAGRRPRGAPAHRVGRRRRAGGHPQAQRLSCLPGLRPVAPVPGARRLPVEPGAARAARAHRREAGRGADHRALRRPRRRRVHGRTPRADDVPGPGLRDDAAGARVLLAGAVQAVHRRGRVPRAGRLHRSARGAPASTGPWRSACRSSASPS